MLINPILLTNSAATSVFALIDNHIINNSEQVKLLGIASKEHAFDVYVCKLCKTLVKRYLRFLVHYMNMNKRRIIMKSFIESQFGYCPLVWMLHSRINRIHEGALLVNFYK